MSEPAKRGRVMVVDDDRQVVGMISRMLSRNDFEPLPAATALQARPLLEGGGYDAVLCDLNLADGNGLSLLASYPRLSGKPDRHSFVMMSGNPDPAVAADVRSLGATFLAKPFGEEELIAAVDAAVAE